MITTFILSLFFFYEYVLNVQWAQNPGRRDKYIVRSVTIYNYQLILLGWLIEGWDAGNIHYLGEKEDMHIACFLENLKARDSFRDENWLVVSTDGLQQWVCSDV